MSGESRGEALVAEAEKVLNRFTLFGSGSKKEEAVELYSKAGNAFKVAKRCKSVSCSKVFSPRTGRLAAPAVVPRPEFDGVHVF